MIAFEFAHEQSPFESVHYEHIDVRRLLGKEVLIAGAEGVCARYSTRPLSLQETHAHRSAPCGPANMFGDTMNTGVCLKTPIL